jgi:hypothetical protein
VQHGTDIMRRLRLPEALKLIVWLFARSLCFHVSDKFNVLRMEKQRDADKLAARDLKALGFSIELLDQRFWHVN